MSDSFNKRLEEIKEINEEAITANLNGDPNMELHDIVMKQWEREHIDWLIEQAAKASMYRDTLNYIAGNSHLTTDTLQEARDAANGVLEEAGE